MSGAAELVMMRERENSSRENTQDALRLLRPGDEKASNRRSDVRCAAPCQTSCRHHTNHAHQTVLVAALLRGTDAGVQNGRRKRTRAGRTDHAGRSGYLKPNAPAESISFKISRAGMIRGLGQDWAPGSQRHLSKTHISSSHDHKERSSRIISDLDRKEKRLFIVVDSIFDPNT